MRHKKAGNRLGRKNSHRKATIRDIAKATLIQERICTTLMKAKEARKLVDRLITLGKNGTLADKRRAFAILCDHKLVSNLFVETSPRFEKRQGGYTRIIPTLNRKGDNAKMAFLELTERKVVEVKAPVKSKKEKEIATDDAGAVSDADVAKEENKKVSKSSKTTAAPSSSKKDTSLKEKKTKDKNKSSKRIVGSIKKIFSKKPSD